MKEEESDKEEMRNDESVSIYSCDVIVVDDSLFCWKLEVSRLCILLFYSLEMDVCIL